MSSRLNWTKQQTQRKMEGQVAQTPTHQWQQQERVMGLRVVMQRQRQQQQVVMALVQGAARGPMESQLRWGGTRCCWSLSVR
jgi:hypothetical protein